MRAPPVEAPRLETPYAQLMSLRAAHVRTAVAEAEADALVLTQPANVSYATGYRSVGGGIFQGYPIAAVVTPERCVLVAPAADGAPAVDLGLAADDIVPFGSFHFDAVDGSHPAAGMAGRHDGLRDALVSALAGLAAGARVGVDDPDGVAAGVARSRGHDVTPGGDTLARLRAVKHPAEIERLARAATLAERGIDAAIDAAAVGVREDELAALVAATMAAGGGEPRFVVVTSGPRSALADARASDRRLRPGDLLRFDVGCVVEGYWSDIGRTAVVGAPDATQEARYAAILAGETRQLDTARAGITAGELFDVAVDEVERAGLAPYRRHHCGHAIGTEVYEQPIIASGSRTLLEPGMTFCVEPPYYQLGWGGMMVEDTIVITAGGCDLLSHSPRQLRVVDPR